MKKRRKLGIAALAAVILAGLALVRWMRPYDLATEEARARAAGLPLTAAEVGIPQPPPGEDAWPLWTALAPGLTKSTAREDALETTVENARGADGRLNPSELAAAKELEVLQAGKDARIRQAASRPAMYWPITYNPVTYSFKMAVALRAGAKHMQRETRRFTAEGRYREAAEAAGVGLKIAKQAAAGPTIINALVGIALDAIALQSMTDMLRQAGPNAEAAAAVRSILAENPPAYDVAFAMRGETVFQMNALDQAVALGSPFIWRMGSMPSGVWGKVLGMRPPAGLWRYLSINPSKAAELHWMVLMVEAARKPDPARITAMRRVAAEVNALTWWNPTYMPVQGNLDILPKFAERVQAEDARRAVLLAAAAVLEYRARHGAYPARLTDALPKPPMDPYTGKPLIYQRAGKGFVVRAAAPPPTPPAPRPSALGTEFRYP